MFDQSCFRFRPVGRVTEKAARRQVSGHKQKVENGKIAMQVLVQCAINSPDSKKLTEARSKQGNTDSDGSSVLYMSSRTRPSSEDSIFQHRSEISIPSYRNADERIVDRVGITSSESKVESRVQMYDHSTMYLSDYAEPAGVVQRLSICTEV